MTTAFDAPLNEAFRNAMLALYLHEAVPKDPYLIEKGLTHQIRTPNDLYEYWLLDVLVSQDVPTSPVACAIASYQQQINSIMLNMEPGYSDDSFTPQQIKTWRDGLNRYPIWSAIQQLHYFPDIYLDPTLRLTKSDSFVQLENDLNQAQIQPETVQTAVLSYLAKFEEIANLKICNGYIDGEDFANSPYYFIGKSPAEDGYYWRSLDMSQRPVKEPAAGPGIVPDKFDKPLPNAWSDWRRANVPISEKALEHTIRPCWFNNRLFVVWAVLELQDADATELPVEGRADASIKVNPRFRLYASYKKYDDSWSTPRIYIENYCQTKKLIEKPLEQIAKETQTIAVYDHSTSPESMVIMLYSNYHSESTDPDKDTYDFLRTVRIDKNFNVTALFPSLGVVPNVKQDSPFSPVIDGDGSAHVLLIGHIFANSDMNAGRFQYWLPSGTPLFGGVEHDTPSNEKNTWDFAGWQSRIKTSEKDVDLIYNRTNSNIELTVGLNDSFADYTTIKFSASQATKRLSITLVFSQSDNQSSWVTLLEGSSIQIDTSFMERHDTVYCLRGDPDGIRSLISDPDSNNRTQFSLPAIAPGQSASLAGKLANTQMLYLLQHYPQLLRLKDFWRFSQDSGAAWMPLDPAITIESVESYGYQLFIGHAIDVQSPNFPVNFENIRTLYTSTIVSRLPKDSKSTLSFSIDQNTHEPDGWPVDWPDAPDKLQIPLIYGVLIHKKGLIYHVLLGGALKALTVGWGQVLSTEPQKAPRINTDDSPSLGNAQYIDFTESSISLSDGDKTETPPRAPIRMNTTFARELIQLAESGMDPLLSWDTQTQQTEPPIPNGLGAQAMDFSGAYYLYFLELFLYLPWLVAYRLNEEQQYEEAKHWLAYLFDPSRQSADPGHPGYWQSVPLETPVWPGAPDPSQAILYPDDPHQIALSFPVHFRKALYGLYIDIESNQADQAYRELTPDGLAEAKLRYVHILALLGPPPHAKQVDVWSPVTLDKLSAARNKDLRAFEQQLIATQRQLQDKPPLRIGKAPQSQDAPLLCLRPYGEDSSLATVDNPYLRRPFNPELIKRWDRVESRLYNLRHNLDMAGNPLNLPLFAAPLDPRALLAALAQGLSGAALSRLLSPQIPHYRFSFMFALAQNAVDSVIQFGSTLLSLIERKEQAQYLELQQQQAWNLAKVAVDIQAQAMQIDEKNREALLASQVVNEGRLSYYLKLVDDGLSRNEKISNDARLHANTKESGLALSRKAGALARTIPNIFGVASGGIDLGAVAQGAADIIEGSVIVDQATAQNAEFTSQFDRRDADWRYMSDQAKLEAEQIKAQLAVYEEQHKATQLQLRQAQTALNQAKATHDFLLSSNRFSRSQTYDWLNSKFAGFYHTAYTTAQSLCQAAEACWQYEMGDFARTFILPGAWNASYRGFGAGEVLKMSLQQMHSQYLQNNRRDLEIRKTVSLKDLNDKDAGSTINKPWAEIKKSLVDNGTCEFELTQAMFDDDYAGENHYLRRIKTISVTLPACLGPYQDIRAVLRQTYSKVEMAATAGNAKENLRASQQIALSTSLEDNGMFQLNFQDERYLPFEYTGAVSRWRLIFPNKKAQEAMLKSLTDLIVHVSYTARREGGSL